MRVAIDACEVCNYPEILHRWPAAPGYPPEHPAQKHKFFARMIGAGPSPWTITLPIALSSANDHIVNGNHAATRGAYRKRRAAYLSALVAKARHVPRWGLAGEPGPDEAHRWVTIRRLWGKGQRMWDDDNMVAACKALRDVMQRPKVSGRGGVPKLTAGAGLIVTDGPKWATFRYRQVKASDGVARVEVEIGEEVWT